MTESLHQARIEAVQKALSTLSAKVAIELGELVVTTARDQLVQVLTALRDSDETQMVMLMDVCGVDYPERRQRFDVVYQLLSLKHNDRVRVIVQTDEVAAVPSVVEIYPSAGWFEREAYDLYGINFANHPDLRRILTDYGFRGHPLRRDFPLVGFTEVHYDDLQRRVVSRPVTLQQDYRAFDALSPWQGVTDVQKRGGQE